MRTRFMTTLVMVAGLLVSGQALAQPPTIPNFQRGQVLTADELNLMVGQINKNTKALGAGDGETRMVDCGSGETIMAAMEQAQPGDTVMITGTCNENVVVNKDGVALVGDGQGTTVIDGGGADAAAIAVIGNQDVTIKGLTARNGLNGIYVTQGAAAWLENVAAQGSRAKPGHGSGHGIIVSDSSNAVLAGDVVANRNAVNGVLVWHSSSVSVVGNFGFQGRTLPPASLQANDNGGTGIAVGLSSALQVISLHGEPTAVQAIRNGSRGINLLSGASVQFGGGADIEATGNRESGLVAENGSSATFVAWASNLSFTGAFNGNGGDGISVWGNSIVSAWDAGFAANITGSENNGAGLSVIGNSRALFESPVSASPSKVEFRKNGGNGIDVFADGSLYLGLPSEISGNTGSGVGSWGSSLVDVRGNAMISGNSGDGISAWNGVSIYLRNVTLTGNTGSNVRAGQGSRLDWSGGQVDDPISCDRSVLAFVDASCSELSDQ